MTFTVSVGFSPFSAVVGVLVIGAGVAMGIAAAEVLKANSKQIAEETEKLFGRKEVSK